jgi:hypothetical protein
MLWPVGAGLGFLLLLAFAAVLERETFSGFGSLSFGVVLGLSGLAFAVLPWLFVFSAIPAGIVGWVAKASVERTGRLAAWRLVLPTSGLALVFTSLLLSADKTADAWAYLYVGALCVWICAAGSLLPFAVIKIRNMA